MGIHTLPFCQLQLITKIIKGEGYPHHPQTIGQHLRKRRMDLNMKQKDLGATLGCDTCNVWNWENGHNAPEFRFLPKIIAFLGYDPRTEPTTSLSERLVFYRQGRGLSQVDFAKFLGVDPTTLARWERDERQPSGKYERRIETVLGAVL